MAGATRATRLTRFILLFVSSCQVVNFGPRHIHSVQQEIARLQDERQKLPLTWQKDSLEWPVVVFRSFLKLWIQMFALAVVPGLI